MIVKKDIVSHTKEIYKKGDRVHLFKMKGEPQLRPGSLGTIRFVDDAGQIHVSWDNGSSLALILNEDEFVKI